MKRLIAVGDIHGCYDRLCKLLRIIKLKPEDALVFLGDYIDRGFQSKEVVSKLIELNKRKNVICLKGNHEQMLIDFLNNGPTAEGYLVNGGRATLDSYRGQPSEEHLSFLKSLPLYYESGRFVFVHAGVIPGIPLEEQDCYDLVWVREEFLEAPAPVIPGKVVVFGHTIVGAYAPWIESDRIGLDTGAFLGGCLTAMDVLSGDVYQVPFERRVENGRIVS